MISELLHVNSIGRRRYGKGRGRGYRFWEAIEKGVFGYEEALDRRTRR